MLKRVAIFSITVASLLGVFTSIISPIRAKAVTAADWNAGNIIDDTLFTDKSSMSVSDIQTFLNAEVGTGNNGVRGQCDTNGSRTSELGGGTRAQYGATNGNSAPFTCLKDYYEVPKLTPSLALPLSNYGGVAIPSGAKSSAQIIWDAAQKYNISPKVLLTTLQKESAGPLITDDWPFKRQYDKAMGAHCPDTGPGGSANCDPNYAGFSIQINESAALFRYYLDNMFQPWWPYKKPGINLISYGLIANSCPSSNVNIVTMATAALYTYTPYQPNQAVLDNMYGSAPNGSCNSYGNRNFWRIYNDWFGSPNGTVSTSFQVRLITPITAAPTTPVANEIPTVSFTVQNFSDTSITSQTSVLQCRYYSITNCDSAYDSPFTLQPGEQKAFTYTLAALHSGDYVFMPYFKENGIWYKYGSNTGDNNYLKMTTPSVRLTSPIILTPTNPVIGDTTTVTFSAKNYGSQSYTFQTSVLQCRFNTSTNCDSSYDSPITLLPGEQRTFRYNVGSLQLGSYTLVPYFMQNGTWYRYGSDVIGSNVLNYTPPPMQLVGNITVSPVAPIPGQTMTVSYDVKNTGVLPAIYQTSLLQCRLNTLTNCDSAYDAPMTIAAGATQHFDIAVPAARVGTYVFTPYYMQNGNYYKYGTVAPAVNTLSVSVPAYVAPMQLVGNITVSPVAPIPGQTMTVSYDVKNTGVLPAIYQTSLLQCRLNTLTNCDSAYDAPMTIAAGATQHFDIAVPAARVGTYVFTPYYMQNGNYYKYGTVAPAVNTLSVSVPAYVAPMQLVGNITVSPVAPIPGQTMTVSYDVKNTGVLPAIYQTSLLQCRLNTLTNCDSAYDAPMTIAAGATQHFDIAVPAARVGTYVFTPYYMQNGNYYKYGTVAPAVNTLSVSVK